MNLTEFDNKAAQYGLKVRLVQEKDAKKILELRTNTSLSLHLHATDSSIDKQIQYIKDYKIKEQSGVEFYFAFMVTDSFDPIGFYRVHSIDYKNKTFCIGSWIFEKTSLESIPILADILSKEFGFEQLNLDTCFFDVRRDNKKVMKYHKLFSPIFINEDLEQNNYFYLQKSDFLHNKEILLKNLI